LYDALYDATKKQEGEKEKTMKRFLALMLAAGLGMTALTGNASAEGFLFGDETKGATITANEADINIRLRVQPRFDYGDLIKSADGGSYEKETDLYFRRLRLELTGHLLAKTVKYGLILSGDKWEKAGNADEVIVQNAYVEWLGDDAYNVIFGKEKLPYSRVSLTSSSKQLLIERPASTEAAKKLFGETDAYYQPKVAVRGRLFDGIAAYEAAVADGWSNGDAVQSTHDVQASSPVYVARVELSPKGFTEDKKSDSHMGKGRHLTLGMNYALQNAIEYDDGSNEEKRSLVGFDVSGHLKGITGQFEYNAWKIDSTDSGIKDKEPKGWYAQAGYYIEPYNIEPAIRYEVYDQDSNSDDKVEKNTTAGINWYLKGHSLKLGLNWVHTEYEEKASGALSEDDSKDTYQAQAQMYF
jgi:phosphate-selective porin OprO/OprP